MRMYDCGHEHEQCAASSGVNLDWATEPAECGLAKGHAGKHQSYAHGVMSW